jgi:hypothetical protein
VKVLEAEARVPAATRRAVATLDGVVVVAALVEVVLDVEDAP